MRASVKVVLISPLLGLYTEERGKLLSTCITLCFVTLYIAAISALLAWQFNSNRQTESIFQQASLILSILIKIGGLGWRFLAPFVVSLENHRTLKGYDDAWTQKNVLPGNFIGRK